MSSIPEEEVAASSEKDAANRHSAATEQSDAEAAPNTTPDESEFTLQGALALAGSAMAYFCTVGFMNAFGVFQQYYTAHYLPSYSEFQISWIGSVAQFMLFAVAAPAGIVADRVGTRIPILIGSVLLLLAVFMVSLCKEYYQFFLAQAVLLSIGMSFVAIPASTIVPKYFKRNRGLAQGISIGGSSLGGVIWPIVLDQLLYKHGIDFGWSLRIVGFIMMPLLAMVVLAPHGPKVPTDHSAPLGANGKPVKPKGDLTALKSPAYILLCSGVAIAFFGFLVPIYFISVYATSLGFSESLAFYLISILNAASLFGRVLPGRLADRYGPFNVMTLATFTAGIVVFCMTAATSTAGLIVWALAYGFSSGAILSLQLACATLLADEHSKGTAVGIVLASVSVTGLVGAPIAGELIKDGYIALSCFAASTLVVGGVLLGFARASRDRRLFVKV